ncbi:MAG: TIGR03915 family putative DNA repair protein [Peptostreptococcaceae bacterium]
MIVFLYDSTFEGLLTAIYEAYYSKVKPNRIYSIKHYKSNLIDEVIKIETDTIKFQKVYDAIENKISRTSLNKIYYSYLSEIEESANVIYYYLQMGFKLGKDVECHKHNDIVINIDKLSKRVSLERHRFTGFVRFKEINGILYSKIEPDFNILPLIGNHFKSRLTNEYFIIEDTNRDIALIYNKKEYHLTELSQEQKNALSSNDNDVKYEELWKQYFKSTSIRERSNYRLQKRSMPTRYWKNLTEIDN